MAKKRKKKQHRRTYKYQIREHPQNMRLVDPMLDDLCDVHNHFLRLQNRYYRRYEKHVDRWRLQPHLTDMLKRTHQHWAWIPRDTLDAVIIRLELAWQRFFDIPGCGRPKFKRKGRYRSAKFQSGYLLEEGRVRLSFKEWDEPSQSFKFNKRWFSFHHHRDWEGNVKYIQILRDNVGTYWKLYVITDDASKEVLPATGESVGADFGLDTYLTLSTGEKIQSPQYLKQSLKELRKLNKALSRKVKGSGNWWRCVRELARLYRHVTNQRKDWHFKLATDLGFQRFDLIATETLNLDGMKRLWGRKVSDLAFGEFVDILKFKCFKDNREFHQIGQWTPTTKPCSDCGYQNKNLTLSDRQWTCPECGCHHDRDINAAINILRAACGPVVEQI